MEKHAVPPPPWLQRVCERVRSILEKADHYEVKASRGFPVLEGHDRAKEFAEDMTSESQVAAAAAALRDSRGEAAAAHLKEFTICIWNPDAPERPCLQSFYLDLREC